MILRSDIHVHPKAPWVSLEVLMSKKERLCVYVCVGVGGWAPERDKGIKTDIMERLKIH